MSRTGFRGHGLGDLKILGVKAAEHVDRQTFIEQGGCEQIDDAALERAQIGDADGGNEEREQRARVGDQKTLAPVEPEQVRLPVVALWRRLDQPDRLLAEQSEQLPGAADDHLREPNLAGGEYGPQLRGEPILVDQPAENVAAAHAFEIDHLCAWRWGLERWQLLERTMRAVCVVVRRVFAEH